jgi:hypothetical protein
MEKSLLEELANHLGSSYLSALNDPQRIKNDIPLSKVILLYNADDESLKQLKDSMRKYFAEKKEPTIKIVLETEVSTNHNYKIDVGYFLDRPIPRY